MSGIEESGQNARLWLGSGGALLRRWAFLLWSRAFLARQRATSSSISSFVRFVATR